MNSNYLKELDREAIWSVKDTANYFGMKAFVDAKVNIDQDDDYQSFKCDLIKSMDESWKNG